MVLQEPQRRSKLFEIKNGHVAYAIYRFQKAKKQIRLGALVPRVTISGNQIVAGANAITVIGVTLSGSGGMAADADQPYALSTAAQT